MQVLVDITLWSCVYRLCSWRARPSLVPRPSPKSGRGSGFLSDISYHMGQGHVTYTDLSCTCEKEGLRDVLSYISCHMGRGRSWIEISNQMRIQAMKQMALSNV